jgi:hypothetical protein
LSLRAAPSASAAPSAGASTAAPAAPSATFTTSATSAHATADAAAMRRAQRQGEDACTSSPPARVKAVCAGQGH